MNFSAFWNLMWRMDFGEGWLRTADGRAVYAPHPGYNINQDKGAPAR